MPRKSLIRKLFLAEFVSNLIISHFSSVYLKRVFPDITSDMPRY